MDLVLDLFPLIYDFPIAGIAAKPSPYWWMFFPPIAFITTYLLFHVNAEPIAVLLFSTSGYLLLIDVQREPRLISQAKSISDMHLSDRLGWAIKLITVLCGIGWEHEPTTALPPSPRPTGLTCGLFIVLHVGRLVLYLLLFNVCQTILKHNPSFHVKTAPPIAELGLLSCSYTMVTFVINARPLMTS